MSVGHITNILNHPRFIGLWTYKGYGAERKFCASVVINGLVAETGLYITWEDALLGAKEILDEE